MKFKTYKYGNNHFRAYEKQVGNGWEIGVTFKGRTLFVGNFIHLKERVMYWKKLNMGLKTFGKKFSFYSKAPNAWFCKFLSDYLYKDYYLYLNNIMPMHHRLYTKKFTRGVTTYKRTIKKVKGTTDTHYYLKAA
jgi:hypothetical protein